MHNVMYIHTGSLGELFEICPSHDVYLNMAH